MKAFYLGDVDHFLAKLSSSSIYSTTIYSHRPYRKLCPLKGVWTEIPSDIYNNLKSWMSINTNFPKQNSLLGRTFLQILLLSFFPPSDTFPSSSHIFYHSHSCSTRMQLLDLSYSAWNPKPRKECQKKFLPQRGSFIPNFAALNQHLHCFWCPEHEWKLLLYTEKSWVIKLASKYLALPTSLSCPEVRELTFIECCILLQLAQLCQVSVELFHRSTPRLLHRPDRSRTAFSLVIRLLVNKAH